MYLRQGVNTKNITYINIHYTHMLHFMIKLRPDLEFIHQASHFGIWFIQIRQIEVDINHLNILGLERIYLSGCSKFEQVGTGQNWFLMHVK